MAKIEGSNTLGMIGYTSFGQNFWQQDMELNLRTIDGLMQARVISMGLSTPPASPGDGDCYIPALTPTGAWAGMYGKIARYNAAAAAWEFWNPKPGWTVWNLDGGKEYVFQGSWTSDRKFGDVSADGVIKTSNTTRIDASGNIFGLGGTFAGGTLIVSAASSQATVVVDSQAGYSAITLYRRNGGARWGMGLSSDAESSGNAGSTWFLRSFSDASTTIDDPVSIVRAAGGAISLARKVNCSSGIGFFGTAAPTSRPAVSGSRASNAALASLISQLTACGIISDSTTA